MTTTADNHIFQFLSTNGDGTGTVNANGDYSSTEGEFYIAPPSGYHYNITRMLVFVEDSANFSSDEYGNLNTALTNGVRVVVKEHGTEILDLTAGDSIKTNAQWSQYCYDAQSISFGSGNDFLAVRWTFAKSGSPVYVSPNQRLSVLLNDNLTGLVTHTFMVQGYRRAKGA